MIKFTFIIFLVMMIGCVTSDNAVKHSNLPVLIDQEALPALPLAISKNEYKLEIRMQIDEIGEVTQAHFLKGSGDAAWDSLAIQTIKKWKFDPARIDGKPLKRWIVQKANVKVDVPFFMTLSEIVCGTFEQANKVFNKLKEGRDFNQLALQFSLNQTNNSNGTMNRIDVNKYPTRIGTVLKKLAIGQFTEPIEYDKQIIIFKRIE